VGPNKRNGRRGGILFPALILVLVVGALWLSRFAILGWMGTRLELHETPQKADAILILAGGLNGDRILRGGQLVKDGYAPIAFFSGAHSNYDTLECDWAFPYAARHGYPSTMFQCVPHTATSTREEAQQLTAELRRIHAKKVLLVTSDYHTRRAGWLFRKTAPDIEFIVVGTPTGTMKLDRWWETRDGRKTWFIESVKSFTEYAGL
jgi:uncharacterized SAM-binding protein YcdF (DUF218 family)